MATITLDQDRSISYLISDLGLAAGDTIQLAGHSFIVDADAVDYPVTIANFGADANLELRDLGRIKLNVTLPANVHPWIDPAHPLPMSAEPGIDGDPYRTPLTANARAEIQLNGKFGLGGGDARLPTAKREGNWWGVVAAMPASNQVVFDRNMALAVGDYVLQYSGWNSTVARVTAWDAQTRTATFSVAGVTWKVGSECVVCGGGVVVYHTGDADEGIINADIEFGTLNLLNATNRYVCLFGCSARGKRLCGTNINAQWYDSNDLSVGAVAHIEEAAFSYLVRWPGTPGIDRMRAQFLSFGTVFCYSFDGGLGSYRIGRQDISVGELHAMSFGMNNPDSGRISIAGGKMGTMGSNAPRPMCCFSFGPDMDGSLKNKVILSSGTVTRPRARTDDPTDTDLPDAWYHAPATAADVTWRYTDRIVAPGATLRLRCAWKHEGGDATSASIAVTDQATWWPQLWQLGAEPLAKVEFDSSTSNEQIKMLSYRNTSDEPMQVRVWECVTGSTDGGYLSTKEVQGGPL